MTKFIAAASLLIVTTSVSSNDVDSQIIDSLLSDVARCSSQFNLNVDGDLRGSIKSIIVGDGAAGEATIGLSSFMKIFPERDRIKAYELYVSCLATKYNHSGSDDSVLTLSSVKRVPVEILGNISNERFALEKFIDGKSATHRYTFTVSGMCTLNIRENKNSQSALYPNYRLTSSKGTEMGSNRIRHKGQHRLHDGSYNLEIFLESEKAGVYVADIEVNC